MTAWHTDKGVYIRAGCFWSTLDAFKTAVQSTHGDSEHGVHYRAAIALVEARFPQVAQEKST